MDKRYDDLLQTLKNELVMALGCTEPGVVAFCAAAAAKLLDEEISALSLKVSAGIYKNGATTFIPSTGKRGLVVAAALGAVIAEPKKELMILNEVTEEHLEKMNVLLEGQGVTVEPLENEAVSVYVEAWARDRGGNSAHAIISGSHTNLILLEKNGNTVFRREAEELNAENKDSLADADMEEFFKFIEKVPLQQLLFLKDSIKINWGIAEYGIGSDYGLKIGKTMKNIVDGGIWADDIVSYTCMMTTAAVDVRMGGHSVPAMACGGSGNQGILASVPIIATAKMQKISEEKLLRALALSYLITIYTKAHLGRLSVLCGCSTAAGIGCAAGLTFLMGGDRKQIKGAIHNLLAGLSGMICDGAKEGCSFKILNAVMAIVQASLLALQGVMASREDGIIGITEEETIGNLRSLSQQGMSNTDSVIIGILKQKINKECAKV